MSFLVVNLPLSVSSDQVSISLCLSASKLFFSDVNIGCHIDHIFIQATLWPIFLSLHRSVNSVAFHVHNRNFWKWSDVPFSTTRGRHSLCLLHNSCICYANSRKWSNVPSCFIRLYSSKAEGLQDTYIRSYSLLKDAHWKKNVAEEKKSVITPRQPWTSSHLIYA